ncbi:hypothetical protein GCM10010250_21970 [Streptomyces althioticus]|nr:hypothetical protein GCM10010250_21970 [Streptomyces althioticus]
MVRVVVVGPAEVFQRLGVAAEREDVFIVGPSVACEVVEDEGRAGERSGLPGPPADCYLARTWTALPARRGP